MASRLFTSARGNSRTQFKDIIFQVNSFTLCFKTFLSRLAPCSQWEGETSQPKAEGNLASLFLTCSYWNSANRKFVELGNCRALSYGGVIGRVLAGSIWKAVHVPAFLVRVQETQNNFTQTPKNSFILCVSQWVVGFINFTFSINIFHRSWKHETNCFE